MSIANLGGRWVGGDLEIFNKATKTTVCTIQANGDASVAGTLTSGALIDGGTYTGDLEVTGDVTVDTDLDVQGDTTAVDVTLTGALALAAGGFTMAAIARTATADGTTTGTIADGPMLQFISVTSASADNIVILPAPTPGSIVILHVAATGFELRTSAPATVAINGGAEANAESAIGANTTVLAICATATSWKALQMGSDGTLAQVEAAAA